MGNPGGQMLVLWRAWPVMIATFVNARYEQDLYHCPGYRGLTIVDTKTNSAPSIGGINLGSYGLNDRGVRLGLPNAELGLGYNYPAARESSIRNPADMIAIGDSYFFQNTKGAMADTYFALNGRNAYGWSLFAREYGADSLWRATGALWRATSERHDSRFNVLLCEGHVESIPHDRLFAQTESAMRRWNVDNEPHMARQILRNINGT